MSRILVVWEDELFESLTRIAKRRLSAKRPTPAAAFPDVLFHTSKGNGKFAHYVGSTWQNVSGQGLPGSPGKIDHVVCVVDADKLADLLLEVEPPPSSAADIQLWHVGAEATFESFLRKECLAGGGRSETVHGVVLRWSKESLLLAAFESAAAADRLSVDVGKEEVTAFLASCEPDPRTVSDAHFVAAFRRPRVCLDSLRGAHGLHALPKNAIEVDDTLEAVASNAEDLEVVCARTPDIDRIVERVWRLATGPAPTVPKAAPAGASKTLKAQRSKKGR